MRQKNFYMFLEVIKRNKSLFNRVQQILIDNKNSQIISYAKN